MIITRRNFLLGSGAALVALASAPAIQALDGLVITSELEPHYRSIYDIIISNASHNMPGVSRILYGLYRGASEVPIFQIGLHPMGTMRWVAVPSGELLFPRGTAMRFEINPSTSDPHINVFSMDHEGERWSEVLHWRNDKMTIMERQRLSDLPKEEDDSDPMFD